jgi:hypothetical protein
MTELHVLSRFSDASAGFIHARKRSYRYNIYVISISGLFRLKNGEIIVTNTWSSSQILLFRIFNYLNIFISKVCSCEFYIFSAPCIDKKFFVNYSFDRVIIHNTWNGFISSREIRSVIKSKYYYVFLHDFTMINSGSPCLKDDTSFLRKWIFEKYHGTKDEIYKNWLFISPLYGTSRFVFENFKLKCITLENVLAEDFINKVKEDFYFSQLTHTKKVLVFTYNSYKGKDFTLEILNLLVSCSNKEILFILIGEKHFKLESKNMLKIFSMPSQPYSSVLSIMKSVDVVMINSTHETYSMVAAEARYLGKLLFARDHLVFKEIPYNRAFYYATPKQCVDKLLDILNE